VKPSVRLGLRCVQEGTRRDAAAALSGDDGTSPAATANTYRAVDRRAGHIAVPALNDLPHRRSASSDGRLPHPRQEPAHEPYVLTAAAVVAAGIVIVLMSALYTSIRRSRRWSCNSASRSVRWKLPDCTSDSVRAERGQFDKRLLDFDADAQEVIMADQKRLVVDAFARYASSIR